MKKLMIYLTAILMVMYSTTVKAQNENVMVLNSVKSVKKAETKVERKEVRKENRNLVSDMSIEAFKSDFGKVSEVQWEKDPFFDIAMFTKSGHQYKAFYDQHSKLVGTITEKTFADLPLSAQKEIKKRYRNYTVDKVVYFEDNQHSDQDMLLYGTQFEDADNYFAELSSENKNIIIQINPEGWIFFFKELQKRI